MSIALLADKIVELDTRAQLWLRIWKDRSDVTRNIYIYFDFQKGFRKWCPAICEPFYVFERYKASAEQQCAKFIFSEEKLHFFSIKKIKISITFHGQMFRKIDKEVTGVDSELPPIVNQFQRENWIWTICV